MFRANVPQLAFDFTVLLPHLNFTGQYQLKIKLLLLDLQGGGQVTGMFSECERHSLPGDVFAQHTAWGITHFPSTENSRADVRIRGKTVRRLRPTLSLSTTTEPTNATTTHSAQDEYDEYVSFHKLETKIHIGKARFKLANLFGGDPTLSQVGNQFVNENADLFVAELVPGMEKSLSKTFLDIVNAILHDVTFDEMFPDT